MQRSHLVSWYGAWVRYSRAANVNTPFFQVSALESQAQGNKGDENIFRGFYCTQVERVVSLHWKLIWITMFNFASCSCEIQCHLEESKIQEIVKKIT